MKATRSSCIVLACIALGVVSPAAAQKTPANPAAKTAYTRMVNASRDLAVSANKLTGREVSMKDLPRHLVRICRQRCEVLFYNCTAMQAQPGFPDFSDKAPKDFPVDVPQCDGPDCKSARKPAAGPSCSEGRSACEKKCDALLQ